MKAGKEWSLRDYKWQMVIICAVVAIVLWLALSTDLFEKIKGNFWGILGFFGLFIIIVAILTMLSKIGAMLDILNQIGSSMESTNDLLEKSRSEISQISKNTRLNETAKAIAFREANKQSLQEAVFDKLSQQDFETTFEIIDEIAHQSEYKELADALRQEAMQYRNATDQERINQVIAHIDKLLDSNRWAKASAQIEALIKAAPGSEKAKAMRQKLMDKKDARKKELLRAWDDAVKRQDTDQSLEILKELDLYLTPNEGLALQEAARDIFRNKLHNLGVQFSLAVSSREWSKALVTAEQIIRDFPNSRMAEEIREKIDALRENAQQHS